MNNRIARLRSNLHTILLSEIKNAYERGGVIMQEESFGFESAELERYFGSFFQILIWVFAFIIIFDHFGGGFGGLFNE